LRIGPPSEGKNFVDIRSKTRHRRRDKDEQGRSIIDDSFHGYDAVRLLLLFGAISEEVVSWAVLLE
jgi:hypothetical protein